MIRLRGVSKAYAGRPVLTGLSFDLPDATVTVLMGPSGVGKTTIATILLGLSKPDSGEVVGLQGRRFAAVFQEDRLCPQLSAVANVRLVTGAQLSPENIAAEFAAVGMSADDLSKPVRELSGGQQRRVAILRALLATSDIVCLDEPFKGLDVQTKATTIAYVRNRLAGKTAVLITHDQSEADAFPDAQIIRLA